MYLFFLTFLFCSLLVTTSADQTARIWKTSDFTLLQELKHEAQRWVWDAAFSADSQYILTGNFASYIILIFGKGPQWLVLPGTFCCFCMKLMSTNCHIVLIHVQHRLMEWPVSGMWKLGQWRGSTMVTRRL
jgi:hypothetical protein